MNITTIFSVIGSIIYVFGVIASINWDTTEYEYKYVSYKDKHTSIESNRDATTKDMWLALVWPLRIIKFVFFITLELLNDLMQYPLLLIGIKYKGSKIDRKIKLYVERY